MKTLPVIIEINPKLIEKSDLLAELRIDKTRLDKELRHQPGKYAWWAMLYASCTSRASYLRDKRDRLEAKLALKYRKEHRKATEIKHRICLNEEFIAVQDKLRRWEDAERMLKYAERAFTQRGDVLRSYNSNVRTEKRIAEED